MHFKFDIVNIDYTGALDAAWPEIVRVMESRGENGVVLQLLRSGHADSAFVKGVMALWPQRNKNQIAATVLSGYSGDMARVVRDMAATRGLYLDVEDIRIEAVDREREAGGATVQDNVLRASMRICNVDYERAFETLLSKLAAQPDEKGENALLRALLDKRELLCTAMRGALQALPQGSRDELAAAALNGCKEQFKERLLEFAEKSGLCFEVDNIEITI